MPTGVVMSPIAPRLWRVARTSLPCLQGCGRLARLDGPYPESLRESTLPSHLKEWTDANLWKPDGGSSEVLFLLCLPPT